MTDLLTPATIRSLLAEHGLAPSRALGQNFLADPNTARRIVRLAGLAPGARVLEIGPGVGSLTAALVEAEATVTALELDRHVLPLLAAVLEGTGRPDLVRVVQGDALAVDLDDLVGPDPIACVSNLPYNVATPVVVRALETAPVITDFLVMVQREVGERLAAPPGSRIYGAVSVKVAYYATAAVVGTVPATVFHPRPKVERALVRLVRRPAPIVEVDDPERMFAIVRAGFATRRKSLRQSLRSVCGDATDRVLARAGIDPMTRAEQLGLESWAELTRADSEVER